MLFAIRRQLTFWSHSSSGSLVAQTGDYYANVELCNMSWVLRLSKSTGWMQIDFWSSIKILAIKQLQTLIKVRVFHEFSCSLALVEPQGTSRLCLRRNREMLYLKFISLRLKVTHWIFKKNLLALSIQKLCCQTNNISLKNIRSS